MPSEMWIRIRTARKAAEKTQSQMAKALGITRSGYAFLETSHAEYRTNPTITQLRTIAETTGVPLDLIVSDETDTTEIIRSRLPGYKPDARPALAPTLPAAAGDLRAMFWAAVRFACMTRGVSSQKFDAQVTPTPLDMTVDYLTTKSLSIMSAEPSAAEVKATIGAMSAIERALGKNMNKLLIIYARGAVDIQNIATQAKGTFGVAIKVVTSAEQAADILAELA